MKKIFVTLMIFISVIAYSQEVFAINDRFSNTSEIHIAYMDKVNIGALMIFITEKNGDITGEGVILATGKYLGSDKTLMLYKFDNDTVHNENWKIIKDGTVIKKNLDPSFLVDLSSHNKLYVRVYDFNDESYDFEFDITGFKKTYQAALKKYLIKK